MAFFSCYRIHNLGLGRCFLSLGGVCLSGLQFLLLLGLAGLSSVLEIVVESWKEVPSRGNRFLRLVEGVLDLLGAFRELGKEVFNETRAGVSRLLKRGFSQKPCRRFFTAGISFSYIPWGWR